MRVRKTRRSNVLNFSPLARMDRRPKTKHLNKHIGPTAWFCELNAKQVYLNIALSSPKMDDPLLESLKLTRLIHRLLLTATIAIFLFALSPNREYELKQAIGFLERLESLPDEQHRTWAENIASRQIMELDDFLRNLFEEVNKLGGPETDWSFYRSDRKEVAPYLTTGQASISIENHDLDYLNRCFRDNLFVRKLTLPTDKLARKITLELEANSGPYKLDNLAMNGTAGIGRFDVQMYFYDSKGALVSVFTTIKSESQDYEQYSLHDWLDNNGHTELIHQPDAQNVVFAPLTEAWPFIRDKTVAEAKNWIYQEILKADETNKLEVFSFSVSENQATIVAPAIVSGLLLALGAYTCHSASLITPERSQLISEFAWLPLFSSSTGRVARVLSIIVLPITGNAWLMARAFGLGSFTTWIIILLIFPSVFFASKGVSRILNADTCARKKNHTDDHN